MQRSDHKEFRRYISQLGAAFRTEATTLLLQGYWLGLKDIPIAELKAAIPRAIQSCEFMPTVAALRALVQQSRKRFPTVEEERARIASERAERKRIAGTWEPARQLAGHSEPVTAADIVDEMVARMERKS